jgi:hypothetical protein
VEFQHFVMSHPVSSEWQGQHLLNVKSLNQSRYKIVSKIREILLNTLLRNSQMDGCAKYYAHHVCPYRFQEANSLSARQDIRRFITVLTKAH